jgi:hypothetical protein
MEKFKSRRSVSICASDERRDGAMREMLGMGSDPVGYAEDDKHHKPQESTSTGEWPVAGTASASVGSAANER